MPPTRWVRKAGPVGFREDDECASRTEQVACHPDVLRRIWLQSLWRADASEYLSMTWPFFGSGFLLRHALNITASSQPLLHSHSTFLTTRRDDVTSLHLAAGHSI